MGGTTSKPEIGNLAPQAYETLTKSMEVFNQLNEEYLKCVRWNCNDLFKRYQNSYEEFRNIIQEAKNNNLEKEMNKYLSFLSTANQKWLPDALMYLKCDTNQCVDKEQRFLDAVQILMEQFKQLQQNWDTCSFKESRKEMKESDRKELEFIYSNIYPAFARIYQNLLDTRTTFMANIKTTGMFTGVMTGLVRIPNENKVALVSEGIIADGALERVNVAKVGKTKKDKSTFSKGSRPKMEAVLQSRIKCTIEKQWDWGNTAMENFLFKYRGLIREDIRKRSSILISKILWDGSSSSLSVKSYLSTLPNEYTKWCNRRKGKNKVECLKRPEISTMTDTLKKWVEFTFDKSEQEINKWFLLNSSFINKTVSSISTGVLTSEELPIAKEEIKQEPKKLVEEVEQPQETIQLQESKQELVEPEKKIEGTISIGGGKKSKRSKKIVKKNFIKKQK